MNTNPTPKSKSDLKPQSLLTRYIPDDYKAYAYLGRFDRPIGIWLLALPGWWAIFLAGGLNGQSLWLFILFGIGAIAMRSAGCVINDIWDRDLDRKVERTSTRPLAAKDLSLGQAFKFLMILLFVGLCVLVQMNATTIMLGFLSIPLIIAYPLMKRMTFWPQAFLGLVFNFGVLMGWAAIAGTPEPSALMLYIGAIFWTLGYDTIYAHQDIEDDMIAGIKSTALKFGENSKIWVAGFYGLSFIFMGLAFINHAMLSGVLLLPAAGHLVWQIYIWDRKDPQSALRVFKSNRDCGLLILAAALASGFL